MGAVDRVRPWLARARDLGSRPDDSEDERLAAQILVVSAFLISALTVVWWAVLFALGRPWSAAIPLGYQLATYGAFYALAKTNRFALFRSAEMGMMLILPPVLQWSLGGYVSSGAMILWAFAPALGAEIFGARPWPWLIGFFALAVGSGIADPWLVDHVEQLPRSASLLFFVINVVGVAAVIFLTIRYFIRQRDQARRALIAEQAKSDNLLLNVLPAPIAERLKAGESTIADGADSVTVLFADVVGFTPLVAGMSPGEVVAILNRVFSSLDALCQEHGLEKIKTVGDEYMVVGGLPNPRPDHLQAVAAFALGAMMALDRGPHGIQMRMGIDTGPVVAGVIGSTKFTYDLWGDTVNTASRMESHSLPGRIQVTDRVRNGLQGEFRFESRGIIEVKGKGPMPTHFLLDPVDGT